MLEISTEKRHLENPGADGVPVMERVIRNTLEGVAYTNLTQRTNSGVDSTSKRNEYQEYFLGGGGGVKAVGA